MADYVAENDIPIDYQRRRELDYSDLLPDRVWAATCRATGTPGPTSARARVARSFLFGQLSGLHNDSAPSALDDNEFRSKTADFPRTLTPELIAALHEHATEFLAHQGIYDEPVTWQPSTSFLKGLHLPGPDPAGIDIDQLHQLIHQDHSLGEAAAVLKTTLSAVRHLLEINPAPAQQPTTAAEARTRGHAYMSARHTLTREMFVDLYQHQRISLRDIADGVGVSHKVIARLARDYQIPLREPRQYAKIRIDRDWLYDQYVNQRRALPDLAQETGMSPASMARWAKLHEIPMRSRGGPSHSANLNASLEAAAAPINLQPALTGIGGWERLRRFAAAASYPTLTAAAQALGIHQFTLVNQINRLERDLGGALLNRAERNRPMTTTALGDKVLTAIEVADHDRR
ncbi:LysR family transcriptional regulator [Nocardia sp. CWNU-33]|uniref:helix-turn-helix domain-containing protein n=1 Tax=Nocardia sp. CWNU-33 TaxID=3392117 RepID=UPI00398EBA4D